MQPAANLERLEEVIVLLTTEATSELKQEISERPAADSAGSIIFRRGNKPSFPR